MGRFLTRDTWGGSNRRPLSFNRWGYVEGNPVNLTDATGYAPNEGVGDFCPWDPTTSCTMDEIIARIMGPFFELFGIPAGQNVDIPGMGQYHTTGTPARMFMEATGPGLVAVGDTGLSLMGSPGDLYDGLNAALGYN